MNSAIIDSSGEAEVDMPKLQIVPGHHLSDDRANPSPIMELTLPRDGAILPPLVGAVDRAEHAGESPLRIDVNLLLDCFLCPGS